MDEETKKRLLEEEWDNDIVPYDPKECLRNLNEIMNEDELDENNK